MTEEVKKEKKNNKKALIIILVLLLIGGACAGGYFGYKYYQQVQLEKADAQIVEMKNAIAETLASKETRVEVKESEADKYTLDSFLKMDSQYRVEWDKELDKVKGGFYTARIYGTTEMGNEVMVKFHLTVYVNDDVAPTIYVSTTEFNYQIVEGQPFDVEVLNTIVGEVKDTNDGVLGYSKNPKEGAYHFVIYDDVDVEKLEDGQKFMVVIVAIDRAGNEAYENITVVCSKEAVENPEPEKHEHKWSSWTTVKEPTCTANGSKQRTCECGEKETQSIAALGHDVKWKTTKEATCTETGNREGKCSRCGNTVNETIKALGHQYKVTEEKKATCDEAGHKTEKCSRCGDTKTTTYNALGHDYAAATCTEPKKCKRCGSTTGSALGHSYGWVTIREASKTVTGERHYRCQNGCGNVQKKEFTKWVVDKAAWDETVHHDEVTRQEPIYKSVVYYVFERDDKTTVKYTQEELVAMGYRNASDYFNQHSEFARYYSKTENIIVGYETVVVTPAWDEVIHHPEEGHWYTWEE